MRRLVARRANALVVLILLALASAAKAQQPASQPQRAQPMRPCVDCDIDTQPPAIWLNAPGGDVTVEYPYIEVYWCDNSSLNPSSRWIYVNGVDRTSSFSYTSVGNDCVAHATSASTSVSLNLGSNTLQAHICDYANNCTTQSFTITRRAGPLPQISLAPYSADLQDYGRCAVSCFAATYAQGTVPYFSLDTPRNVTLVYNGDRVVPKPFIHVDVTHTDGSNVPQYFQLRVRKSDNTYVTFLNGETALHFTGAVGTWRLGGQFDAAANGMGSTAVYSVTVLVGSQYSGGFEETSAATRVIVVNETNSAIARGWTLAGIQRLYPNQLGSGVLITEGEGSALYFAWAGSAYTAPAGDFSRLTTSGSGSGQTWTRAYPDSTKVTFDYLGRMTQIADRFVNTTTVEYDGSGRPWILRDPLLLYHAFYYNANGLDHINTAVGITTQVTVQTNRTLTAITDPDGVATTFGYDGSLRLSTVTDRGGATATLGYQGGSDKLATTTATAVPIFGEGTVSPVTTLAAWQLAGVPTGPTSGTPASPPRSDTVAATVTDPVSHVTRFSVNSFGQPLRTGAPLGDTVTVAYNTAGQPTSVVDRLGVTSSFVYDAGGFMTQSTVAGVTTNYRNGGWGQADSVGGAPPAQRFYLNAANGRVDSIARFDGGLRRITRVYYESHGRVERVVDPLFHLIVRTWYDGTNGNRSRDSAPGGRVVSYGYDGYGRAITSTATGQPTRTTTYDAVNRVVTAADGVNPNPTRLFQGVLRLDSVMDPAGQVHRFSYNALGWLTARSDPVGRSESFEYDRDGLGRRVTNRRGQAVEQTYDALHRPYVRSAAGIADTTTYASDGSSATASNALSTETAFLTNTRRLVDSVRTVLRLPGAGTHSYVQRFWYRASDAQLDSTATIDLSGAVSFLSRGYAYNSVRGTLDSIRLGTAGWTRFGYDGDIIPITTHFPGQDSISRGLITGHEVAIANSIVLDDTLHYDSLGRLDWFRTDDGHQRIFGYDGLSRLGSTQYETSTGGGCTWYLDYGWVCGATLDSMNTFQYDPAGNLTGIIRDPVYTWHNSYFYYSSGNRITGSQGPGLPGPSCTYATDLDGNVTSRSCPGEAVSFFWGSDGRLDSLNVNGARMTYRYDAAGRLVRRDSSGVPVSWFLWNGDDLVAELGPNADSKTAEYSYYGLDDLHAVILGSTPYYTHTDVVGNIRGYSSNGTRYGAYAYDEFGRLISGGAGAFGVLERPHWKGALWLEPGANLYYLRNRWYEAATGRFLSEDPIGPVDGLNLYSFAGGDPVQGADPLGLCRPGETAPWCPAMPIGGVTITGSGEQNPYARTRAMAALLLLERECRGIIQFNNVSAMANSGSGEYECREQYGLEPLDEPPGEPPPPPLQGARSFGQCFGGQFKALGFAGVWLAGEAARGTAMVASRVSLLNRAALWFPRSGGMIRSGFTTLSRLVRASTIVGDAFTQTAFPASGFPSSLTAAGAVEATEAMAAGLVWAVGTGGFLTGYTLGSVGTCLLSR